jgi:hypothetical protein
MMPDGKSVVGPRLDANFLLAKRAHFADAATG